MGTRGGMNKKIGGMREKEGGGGRERKRNETRCKTLTRAQIDVVWQ